MAPLPATTARLRVLHQSFSQRRLEGEVSAGGFQWTFSWAFDRGELCVEPSLGRALILALLLIYAILALQFNSFIQPLVILFTVPDGFKFPAAAAAEYKLSSGETLAERAGELLAEY